MEVRAKIDESDRAEPAWRVSRRSSKSMRCRARRSRRGSAQLAGLANRGNFFEIGERDASVRRDAAVRSARTRGSRPASSVRVTLDGKEIADALHVPRQAVFEKNGKNYVFVKTGDRFEQRDVKVGTAHREPRRDLRPARKARRSRSSIPTSPARRRRRRRRRRRCPPAEGQRSERRARCSSPVDPISCPSSGSASRTSARTSCARC